MAIIKIEHLHKAYGEVKAVQDISFQVRKGELFAFLGLNGAGKSTTISILCGQLSKDGGRVEVNGKNIDENMQEIKGEMGVVFQNSVLDKPLSVKDNLACRASLYGIQGKDFEKRLSELSNLFDLKEILHRPVGKLSGGQKRRVDLARALLHEPQILVLDEPTTGLDPQTRKSVWKILNDLRKEKGLTVFLTTHYLEEASEADFVVILDGGKIVAEGTPLQLKNEYTSDYLTLYGVSQEEVEALGEPFEKTPQGFKIRLQNTAKATELILKNPALFTDYELTKGKMDDVFLAVTGKKLEGGNE